MTARPRVWTLVDFGDQIGAFGPSLARPNHVDVIEWDREKVEAVIGEALCAAWAQQSDADMPAPQGYFARAIFDALDPEG